MLTSLTLSIRLFDKDRQRTLTGRVFNKPSDACVDQDHVLV